MKRAIYEVDPPEVIVTMLVGLSQLSAMESPFDGFSSISGRPPYSFSLKHCWWGTTAAFSSIFKPQRTTVQLSRDARIILSWIPRCTRLLLASKPTRAHRFLYLRRCRFYLLFQFPSTPTLFYRTSPLAQTCYWNQTTLSTARSTNFPLDSLLSRIFPCSHSIKFVSTVLWMTTKFVPLT